MPEVPKEPKGDRKESAFDFKRREDPEKKRQERPSERPLGPKQEQEMSLADIRALQKQKFKDHQVTELT